MTTRTMGPSGTHIDINEARAATVLAGALSEDEHYQWIWASASDEMLITNLDDQLISGITVGAFRVYLEPAAGDGFADAAAKVGRYDASKGACIRSAGNFQLQLANENITVRGLQLKRGNGYGQSFISNFDSATGCEVLRNIACDGNSANNVLIRFRESGLIEANLFIVNGSGGMAGLNGTHTLTRNTFWNAGAAGTTIGLAEEGAYADGFVLTGNAFIGFATDCNATTSLSGSHNATNLATGGLPATSRKNSVVAADEWENVTAPTFGDDDGTSDVTNIRLKSTAPDLKDTGTGTTLDMFGQAVSGTADIGSDELQAGGTPVDPLIPAILQQFRRRRAA